MKDPLMLISIKNVYGDKLGATDGDFGHVKDFYFGDQTSVVRYLVADTGSWLLGRQVLLSPHSFGVLEPAGNVQQVHLTRQQIEASPSIEAHKPVSRQYEESYHQYYGWPYYWEGAWIWGMSGFPVVGLADRRLPGEVNIDEVPKASASDAHLRSTKAMEGYQVHASDGIAGHITDFLMEPRSWAITHWVVKTGHRLTGREVQIPTTSMIRVSDEESAVFVSMTKAAVEDGQTHVLNLTGAVA
jgi:hypothetical protein